MAKQAASARNKRRRRDAPHPFDGGQNDVRARFHGEHPHTPCILRVLPLQELVIINKATLEIIFWANILIKIVPSVVRMPSLHLVPISTPLSSKSRDRSEGGADGG